MAQEPDNAAQKAPGAGPDLPEHSAGIHLGRDLLQATRPFGFDSPTRSWWLVGSTFALMIGALTAAGLASWWPSRLVLSLLGGFDTAFFAVLLPMFVASMLGSYLFFAQHSFKRMVILSPESWNYYRAALQSSSYMRLNRVMQWFTGNIGFHHVHQLNVRIPFYRLPEAMAAIKELQSPITTSLAPREIVACFRASLWDEERQRMVSYREAG